MKLVAWNVGGNQNKRSLTAIDALLAELDPDVVVISEVYRQRSDERAHHWLGRAVGEDEWPGLAVYARNGFSVRPVQPVAGLPRFILPVDVDGPTPFQLLAVWPNSRSYHGVLMKALDAYAPWIAERPTIMAGDLNSNTRVKSQAETHPAFVRRAGELGLASAYHELGPHAHGAEPESTFLKARKHSHADGWHLDYCFVPHRMLDGASIEVGAIDPWRKHSDHLPIILEVPDRNFAVAEAGRR